MSDVTTDLKKLLARVFNLSESEITETVSMETLETWDSLQHLNLVLAVEESFGVRFSADEIPIANTFAALCDLIKDKLR